jgi:large subunit ribosomal protein L13
MKTYSMKKAEIDKKWIIIDAQDVVLGRLASIVSMLLRGKHKPTYTPHMDCGDYVIIINAEKVKLTGKKAARKDGKIYYWHTGYAGGIKETTAGKILEGEHPTRVVEKAVKRMITRNNLGRAQMTHLFIYAGDEHPHAAQQPKVIDASALNAKNKR